MRLPKGKYMVLAKADVEHEQVPDVDKALIPGGIDVIKTGTAFLRVIRANVKVTKGKKPTVLFSDQADKVGPLRESFCLTLGVVDVTFPTPVSLGFTNGLTSHYASVQHVKITAITLDKLTVT